MKGRSVPALAVAALLVLFAPRAQPAGAPVVGRLTWFGQACFLLETAAGTRVVMDPFSKGIGYEPPAGLRADLVTISHEHPDHNNVAMVANKPRVVRGLTADKKGWARVDEKFRDVTIRSVGVYHDEKRGGERGLNTVFVFEVGGVRIVHLGDLGHPLTDAQRAAIGAVDVLLVPVGGTYTITAREATRVVDQVRPRLMVIAMHYKTETTTLKGLDSVSEFLDGKSNVRRETARTLALSPVKARPGVEFVTLPYK
jgi:L-ascorbate metabolism protein UlaG (beta-lactamase superfamily)